MKARKENEVNHQSAPSSLQMAFYLLNKATPTFLSAIIIIQAIGISACMDQTAPGVGGTPRLKWEFENVRFEPRSLDSSTFKLSSHYWLRKGEEIDFFWDTFEDHNDQQGGTCTFTSNSTSGNCLVCNYCLDEPKVKDCPSTISAVGVGVLDVVFDESFVKSDGSGSKIAYNTSVPGEMDALVAETCGKTPQREPRNNFEAKKEGIYRLRVSTPQIDAKIKGPADGEVKVHLVNPAEKVKVYYQMGRRLSEQVASEDRTYWSWAADKKTVDGVEVWSENFSPNLSITNVRFFAGQCDPDVSDGTECQEPVEATEVRPSRLLFISNFEEKIANFGRPSVELLVNDAPFRCRARDNPIGGSYFDLTECREDPPNETNPQAISPKNLTPAYNIDNPFANDLRGQIVTWLIEFYKPHGGDGDAATPCDPTPPNFNGCEDLPSNDLIIEFTLRAK